MTLSGSGTDPAAGEVLSYAWTQTGTPAVTLSDAGVASPTFTAPDELTEDTTLTFTLRVSDDEGLYHEDQVSITVVTPRTAQGEGVAQGLTARFEQMPSTHDGSADFTFELHFSEEVDINYRDFTGSVFQVTGAAIRKASRLNPPSNIGWEITVRPSGDDNVVITLPGDRACNVAGAICTSDGEQLSNSISATVAGPAPVVRLPAATIAAGTTPVTEGEAATFTVSLDRAATEALSVGVSIGHTGPGLSVSVSMSVAFAVGDDSKTVTLPTANDNVIGNGSTVTASLSAGSGYTLGATTAASVSVTDNDTATWTVSAQPTSIDEGGTSTVTVAIANSKTFAADQTVSLVVAGTASGSDSTLSATEITLAAGTSSVTATVTATDDAVFEGDETVIVTASHGGSSLGSATVTISANDAPTWSVSAQSTEIDEGGTSTITVAVAKGKTFATNQAISLAVTGTASGSDYTLSATALTLTAGATSATATVTATDDAVFEGDETVIVTASHGGSSLGSATVTISANDTPHLGGFGAAYGDRRG